MNSFELLTEPDRAALALHPLRRRILASLVEPGSATTLAGQLGLPRQKVNYHLQALARAGLVDPVGERARRNCVERLYRRRAVRIVCSPRLLDAAGPEPGSSHAAQRLVEGALRTVEEVGPQLEGGRPPAALALELELAFDSASDRNWFADALTREARRLAREYGGGSGKSYRFVLSAYPAASDG